MAIVVREVWQKNLASEIRLIEECLHKFPYIAIDTEFPGTVFKPTTQSYSFLSTSQSYSIMKCNVDALSLIQLGLTLSDTAGNLPHFGGAHCVWEFNFSDFDLETQLHNPDSITLLQKQGIDFPKNRRYGIDSRHFAVLFVRTIFKQSSLHGGHCMVWRRNLTWVTFHGLYDFGFLIKILTNRLLPDNLFGFMWLMHDFFGPAVYDLKPMARSVGLHGGLEKIADMLMVERAVGRSHQAGSDSFLTMRVLIGLIKKFGHTNLMIKMNYKLFGLTV